MPPKRLTAKQAKAALPEWSQKIVDFRSSLKLSQSELGKQLGASAMAVSRWERAIQEAPANIYIQLGNLAGDPLCWYFWGCAGLRTADVMRVLPAVRRRPDCIFSELNTHPAYPLSTLRCVPRGSSARLEAEWIASPFS